MFDGKLWAIYFDVQRRNNEYVPTKLAYTM